jgi:pimeloyl-[acyl-carrier protein] methyl ester esterase
VYQTLNKLLVKTSGNIDSKETLLLLHGWGMNSKVWEPIRAQLEARYRVSLVDLPGHGFNHGVKANNIDEIVDLIVNSMSGTPEKYHLLGWSLGGLIAQALTLRVPDKVRSLTLVASTPKFSQNLEKGADYWPHAMSLETLNNFADNLKADPEATLKRFVALQFMGIKEARSIQRNLIEKLFKPIKTVEKWGGVLLETGLPNLEALDTGLKLLNESDFREASVDLPQHWLFGGRDRLIPADVINDLKLLRPDAEITLLENAGHAPFMTHPDEFLEPLTLFINGI